MGTDIHGVWQKNDGSKWVDIESNYEQDRHYQLFAVLADVRNGYGFAGVVTGEPVVPVSPPRGLPPDFAMRDDEEGCDVHVVPDLSCVDPRRREWVKKYDDPVEKLCEVWMGDHSHSYLTGKEMLAWYANAPTVVKTGILSREEYDKWDKHSPPESYCGGISGQKIVVVDDNEIAKAKTPGWTHIKCEWQRPLHEELQYFFDEVQRLVNEHGEIRFVFGFDS